MSWYCYLLGSHSALSSAQRQFIYILTEVKRTLGNKSSSTGTRFNITLTSLLLYEESDRIPENTFCPINNYGVPPAGTFARNTIDMFHPIARLC